MIACMLYPRSVPIIINFKYEFTSILSKYCFREIKGLAAVESIDTILLYIVLF